MDRVRNEEVLRRVEILRELASRVKQSIDKVWKHGDNGHILIRFGHMEIMDTY